MSLVFYEKFILRGVGKNLEEEKSVILVFVVFDFHVIDEFI
jgi:hypothetical protein